MRLVLLIALLLPASVAAQSPTAARTDSLFGWLAGMWAGEAVVQTPSGSLRLYQVEDVRRVAGGHGLVFHGRGFRLDDGLPAPTPVFDVAALLFPTPNGFSMRTVTYEGRSVEAHVTPVPLGLDWGFATPDGGHVRYEIRLLPDGRWHERGFYTPPGGGARPIVDMMLHRTSER